MKHQIISYLFFYFLISESESDKRKEETIIFDKKHIFPVKLQALISPPIVLIKSM